MVRRLLCGGGEDVLGRPLLPEILSLSPLNSSSGRGRGVHLREAVSGARLVRRPVLRLQNHLSGVPRVALALPHGGEVRLRPVEVVPLIHNTAQRQPVLRLEQDPRLRLLVARPLQQIGEPRHHLPRPLLVIGAGLPAAIVSLAGHPRGVAARPPVSAPLSVEPERRGHEGGPVVEAVDDHARQGHEQERPQGVVRMLQPHRVGLVVRRAHGGVRGDGGSRVAGGRVVVRVVGWTGVLVPVDFLPLVPDAVDPHPRLDELRVPELADLEHEVEAPPDPPDHRQVAEEHRPRAFARPRHALEEDPDGDRVERHADDDLREHEERELPARGLVVVAGAVADGRHQTQAEVDGLDVAVDVQAAVRHGRPVVGGGGHELRIVVRRHAVVPRDNGAGGLIIVHILCGGRR
mmetsp:Transcript_23731/g.36759  ORF Transcript_23731/g.36759 Transcript_23731/m.36759 type:complete len:405 (+) Transcript_23731:156-1370(+)